MNFLISNSKWDGMVKFILEIFTPLWEEQNPDGFMIYSSPQSQHPPKSCYIVALWSIYFYI